MQEATNEINKMKRLLFVISPVVCAELQFALQESNCKRRSEVGFPLQIRRKVTTLRGQVIMVEQPPGLHGVSSKNGKRVVPCSGSMVNVCDCPAPVFAFTDGCRGTIM
jgi:hypothetical protein